MPDATHEPSKENSLDYQSNEKPKLTSNLQKLVYGVLQLFSRQEKPITELHFVEVMRLKETANQLLIDLKAIRDLLESTVDEELYFYIKAVITTMDQGITTIHEMVREREKHDIARQVKAYENYAHWITDARPWVHLLSNRVHERETIIKCAAIYISAERIERDIRSIKNYPSYYLAEKYRSQVDEALRILLKKLQGLKYLPDDLSVQEINSWKAEVDLCREEYYEEALKIIDNVIRSHEGEHWER